MMLTSRSRAGEEGSVPQEEEPDAAEHSSFPRCFRASPTLPRRRGAVPVSVLPEVADSVAGRLRIAAAYNFWTPRSQQTPWSDCSGGQRSTDRLAHVMPTRGVLNEVGDTGC